MRDGKVFGYVASQLGFSETGKVLLYEHILPRIRELSIIPMDPFEICRPHYPAAELEHTDSCKEQHKLLTEFNESAARVNKAAMLKSDLMLPILDGSHGIDDGVACEIGRYAAGRYGPIIAVRTDVRMHENVASPINLQIMSDIEGSGGALYRHLDEWYAIMKEFAEKIRSDKK